MVSRVLVRVFMFFMMFMPAVVLLLLQLGSTVTQAV
jgi:hypothetical protein